MVHGGQERGQCRPLEASGQGPRLAGGGFGRMWQPDARMRSLK